MACLTPSVESSNHYQFSSLHDSCSEATAPPATQLIYIVVITGRTNVTDTSNTHPARRHWQPGIDGHIDFNNLLASSPILRTKQSTKHRACT